MDNLSSSPTITSCTFSGNVAERGAGGGMYNEDSSPTVTDCKFRGNTAFSGGGGMINLGGSPMVGNCTFTGNSAFYGGGMYNVNSSPTVTNCTISENTADSGGGMANSFSSPTVNNSISWSNTGGEIVDDDDSVTTVRYSDVQGGYAGIGNIDADPMFVDPDNGDYHLSPGSPCIDAADNTAVPKGIDTDLDGDPRFVDDPDTRDTGFGDPPIVDIGAYEFQPVSCPWDLDRNGSIGASDLLALLATWGSCEGCPADFDGDGTVGASDLLALVANWGPCP